MENRVRSDRGYIGTYDVRRGHARQRAYSSARHAIGQPGLTELVKWKVARRRGRPLSPVRPLQKLAA